MGWRSSTVVEYGYAYILANGFKRLYIGVTAQLKVRVQQHKKRVDPKCHTARYNINQLVHFETFTTITARLCGRNSSKDGFGSANWS
jgi:putative endonuclease